MTVAEDALNLLRGQLREVRRRGYEYFGGRAIVFDATSGGQMVKGPAIHISRLHILDDFLEQGDLDVGL